MTESRGELDTVGRQPVGNSLHEQHGNADGGLHMSSRRGGLMMRDPTELRG